MSDESHLARWLRGTTTQEAGTPSGGGAHAPSAAARALAPAARPAGTASLRPGQAFGHYRVERELGRGAMATVYLATDERNGSKVALKLLSLGEDWPADRLDEGRLRLVREAEAASRIGHPDIVEVFEAGEHDGQFYLAMEHVDGLSLDNHASQGRLLPPRMACETRTGAGCASWTSAWRGSSTAVRRARAWCSARLPTWPRSSSTRGR